MWLEVLQGVQKSNLKFLLIFCSCPSLAPGFPAEEGHGQIIKRNPKSHFFRTPCKTDLVDWVGALFLGHIEIGTSSVFLFLTS